MILPYTYIDEVPPGVDKVLYVNASLLKKSACDWHVHLTQMGGYRLNITPDIPQAGTALHKLCSVQDLTGDASAGLLAALAIASKNSKIIDTIKALAMSRPAFPRAITLLNGELAIEQVFKAPWRVYTYNGKTYAIVIYGTFDRIDQGTGSSIIRIADYKSSLYYKDEDALRKYKYEIQFEFYKWMLWTFGARWLPLEYYNMVRDFKLVSQVIVAKFTGPAKWVHGTAKGWSQRQVDTVTDIVSSFVETKLIPMQTAEYIPQNGMLSNSCQHCDFNIVCHAPSDDMARTLLTSNFHQKPYTPESQAEKD